MSKNKRQGPIFYGCGGKMGKSWNKRMELDDENLSKRYFLFRFFGTNEPDKSISGYKEQVAQAEIC